MLHISTHQHALKPMYYMLYITNIMIKQLYPLWLEGKV